MGKHKHISCFKDTFDRFKKAKFNEQQVKSPRYVTDDDMLNELLDLWEQRERDEAK